MHYYFPLLNIFISATPLSGSSFMLRHLLSLELSESRHSAKPVDLNHASVYLDTRLKTFAWKPQTKFNNSTRFLLLARHPYERLLSFYLKKIFLDDEHYHLKYMKYSWYPMFVADYEKLRQYFRQFVIAIDFSNPVFIDNHIQPVSDLTLVEIEYKEIYLPKQLNHVIQSLYSEYGFVWSGPKSTDEKNQTLYLDKQMLHDEIACNRITTLYKQDLELLKSINLTSLNCPYEEQLRQEASSVALPIEAQHLRYARILGKYSNFLERENFDLNFEMTKPFDSPI